MGCICEHDEGEHHYNDATGRCLCFYIDDHGMMCTCTGYRTERIETVFA